jgi:hypothetical protein
MRKILFMVMGASFMILLSGCTEGPIFTLDEEFQLEYIIGSSKPDFSSPVTVRDRNDGPLEIEEIDDSRVNVDEAGTYRVIYKATNSQGITRRYTLRINVVDPLKVEDEEQNQQIYAELIDHLASYETLLQNSFQLSLDMTMLATINDVEDFKITALLEWVIDIQDFYYEFRQIYDNEFNSIEVATIENEHLYTYYINPRGSYYEVKSYDNGPIEENDFDDYQVNYSVGDYFTTKYKYEKIDDNHYKIQCYSKDYMINVFGEGILFEFFKTEINQIITINVSFDDNCLKFETELVFQHFEDNQNQAMSFVFVYIFDHFNDITKIDFSDPIYRFKD